MKLFGGRDSRFNLVFGFSIILFLFVVSFSLFRFFILLKAPLLREGVLTIKEGESASSVIKRIATGNRSLYVAAKIYLILTHKDKRLRPCSIKFSQNDNFLTIINKIIRYKEPLIKVVIFEGMDAFEIAKLLKILNVKNSERFLDEVLDLRLEGFLFPDTYYINKNTPVISLISMATRNFKLKAESILKKARVLSFYETLILASIIQKETYVKEEMPLIAGVFYNRLKRGMPLQADPTVIYALKLIKHKNIDRKLTKKDLEIASPYNTYRYKGLPPTPICNPGIDAIKAAVYPAKTDYLYFVSKGDGTHAFAKTLKEHNLNVKKYRR